MARGAGLLRLLREHREGRLQSVREISCRSEGSGDRTLAILEQPIQLVHERLHFGRMVAFDSLAAPLAYRRQAGAKAPQRRHRSSHDDQAPHDGRSFALFIAAGSFFSIRARVAKILPEPFTTGPMRALPILLLFGAMFYWLWRVRGRRALPVLVRHDSMPAPD